MMYWDISRLPKQRRVKSKILLAPLVFFWWCKSQYSQSPSIRGPESRGWLQQGITIVTPTSNRFWPHQISQSSRGHFSRDWLHQVSPSFKALAILAFSSSTHICMLPRSPSRLIELQRHSGRELPALAPEPPAPSPRRENKDGELRLNLVGTSTTVFGQKLPSIGVGYFM